jgi:hypothetical protein
MGQPRAEVITLMVDEHLRFVLQAPEGGSVDDAVPVPLKGRPRIATWLRV